MYLQMSCLLAPDKAKQSVQICCRDRQTEAPILRAPTIIFRNQKLFNPLPFQRLRIHSDGLANPVKHLYADLRALGKNATPSAGKWRAPMREKSHARILEGLIHFTAGFET